ncbi:hypothetical protein BT638P6_00007 [Bacteroides phage BT638P6]|nr:hypothetical protein BT638P6_00007 [Bacteroides phage BT638P6]
MACLKRISQDLAFDCANPGLISGIAGIEEAIILNYEDISSISASPTTGEAVVTKKAGTRGYTIQAVKNSIQVTEAARANDNAPTMMEISVVMKLLSSLPVVTYIIGLLSGSFLVAVEKKKKQYFFFGGGGPLGVSDFATDSATDGVSTATLKTPDGSCGDFRYTITAAQYNAFKTV